MKITKATVDTALTATSAAAAAALPILVNAGDLSSGLAAKIGGAVAAVVAGYHGGAQVQGRIGTVDPDAPIPYVPSDAASPAADGDPQLPAL